MPELPEVETYLRDLEPLLRGVRVVSARITWPRTLAAPEPDEFLQRIAGRRFVSFARRGKYMVLGLDDGSSLIVHLRMTGRLSVEAQESVADGHVHALLLLEDGRQLHFRDPRKFGRIWLLADSAPLLDKLGPEPWDESFTPAALALRLSGRSAPIKALLLDQRLCAGIGNIYADEALFAAAIHPARAAGSLSGDEVSRLHAAILEVLGRAIKRGGSSLGQASTNYLRPTGQAGGYQEEHQVFRRTGRPCPRCGAPIERILVAQRSTHFCPHCQQ